MKKKDRLYFFPPYQSNESNPYSKNYKESVAIHFDVVEKDKIVDKGARLDLLRHSVLDSIYVLNWPESIRKGLKHLPLFTITILALIVIRIRGAKIVWMLHNLEPHEGLNFYSKAIMSFLYKQSNMIITHSTEAKNKAAKLTQRPLHYVCHPVKPVEFSNLTNVPPTELFIWGTILSYKGIPEFVCNPLLKKYGCKVHIIGKCSDSDLDNRIKDACLYNCNVTYENRRAGNDELVSYCKNSKYVLFPYIEGSVSSSGALIDTIVMGGVPIGPNIGAFHDLSLEGLCLVYDDIEELFDIVNKQETIDKNKVSQFIKENSWEAFADKFNKLTTEL